MEGEELYNVLAYSGRFDEIMVRYFFKQFISGLNHCHESGITHRDLKPANLMVDKLFTLKIVDFGFSTTINQAEEKCLYDKLGSPSYMAPELHYNDSYKGQSVDIFAAGVILFMLAVGKEPFKEAKKNDPFYRAIATGRTDLFWKHHCSEFPEGEATLSSELKTLIESLLSLDPTNRPSIEQIMNHSWMQGEMPSPDRLCYETYLRFQTISEQREAEE